MKIDLKHFALAAAGATMLLTSCIGDLDTLPLNPSDSTSETVYGKDENGYLAGLTKLYFNFVSNDTTDLQVSDGGASELIRAFWTIQEVTADACKCAWKNDAWVRAMNTDTWSDADNDATYAVYVRTLQGIAYVNEYLRQTASDKLSDRGVSSELAAKIQSFRAEARFLRAYFYWIALDVFGDVPFTTETSPFGGGVNPKQASRKDVFDYCISELTDRAGVSAPSSVTADYLLEERARELMWEGHRRTDLIRYGKFTTPSFLWTYKGGTFTGQGFDDYMKIFAIPSSELASNPELHQNPGYGNATDK